MVVYHDGLLDLYLNLQVGVTVLAENFAGPNTTVNNTTEGAENELTLSANLGSLYNHTGGNTCQRQTRHHSCKALTMNVDEELLAHDPNNRVPERGARGLRMKRPAVSLAGGSNLPTGGGITCVSCPTLFRYMTKFIILAARKRYLV
jgi:hypothetical protein